MKKFLLSNNYKVIISPNSIITRGVQRILAHNFQLGTVEFISKSIINFIESGKDINSIVEPNLKEFILSGLEHYIQNGIFVIVPEKIKNNFKSNFVDPFEGIKIQNAIVCFNNKKRLFRIISQLEELGLQCLQLRFDSKIKDTILSDIISAFNTSPIESIELVFNHVVNNIKIFENFKRLSRLYMISNNIKPNNNYKNNFHFEINLIKGQSANKCCGMIHKQYFSPTYNRFYRNNNYNSCLYQKISIDYNGNIKNCPSMEISYGNIEDVKLKDVLELEDYNKINKINKNLVETCKICEFRNICKDCRAFIEDPEDILSKPLKCGYNPYTGEWSEWSKNPLKQKAIDFYGMREMADEMHLKDKK